MSAALLDLPPPALLAALAARHPGRVVLLSSFGREAALLLHLASVVDRGLPVLFLDAGHQHPGTIAQRNRLAHHLRLSGVRDIRDDPGTWALTRALAGYAVVADGHTTGPLLRQAGRHLRVSPLANWDKAEREAYRTRHDLPEHLAVPLPHWSAPAAWTHPLRPSSAERPFGAGYGDTVTGVSSHELGRSLWATPGAPVLFAGDGAPFPFETRIPG